MPKCDHPFNVLLDSDDVVMLAALASFLKCSKAHIIRDAIRFRFTMILNSTPTCASGAPCRVPALFANPILPPVAVPPSTPDAQPSPS